MSGCGQPQEGLRGCPGGPEGREVAGGRGGKRDRWRVAVRAFRSSTQGWGARLGQQFEE